MVKREETHYVVEIVVPSNPSSRDIADAYDELGYEIQDIIDETGDVDEVELEVDEEDEDWDDEDEDEDED